MRVAAGTLTRGGGQPSARSRSPSMTSFAIALAMLPVAIGLGSGSERRQPIAIAVIGGVVFSTLLTLAVVPAMYTLIDDLQAAPARLTPTASAAAG